MSIAIAENIEDENKPLKVSVLPNRKMSRSLSIRSMKSDDSDTDKIEELGPPSNTNIRRIRVDRDITPLPEDSDWSLFKRNSSPSRHAEAYISS